MQTSAPATFSPIYPSAMYAPGKRTNPPVNFGSFSPSLRDRQRNVARAPLVIKQDAPIKRRSVRDQLMGVSDVELDMLLKNSVTVYRHKGVALFVHNDSVYDSLNDVVANLRSS